MLNFSDGIKVDTSGDLRPLHLYDGWYVVGQGMLIPVDSEAEAIKEIERMKNEHGNMSSVSSIL